METDDPATTAGPAATAAKAAPDRPAVRNAGRANDELDRSDGPARIDATAVSSFAAGTSERT
jgi:hypothetical protein